MLSVDDAQLNIFNYYYCSYCVYSYGRNKLSYVLCLGMFCFDFLFQSWGLNDDLRGYQFSKSICLLFLAVGVEQRPAWISLFSR